MSKNSKHSTSNCILVSKGGSLKEMHIAESEMCRAKYAAICKTPPTYENAFKRCATWTVKKYGLIVELWARADGRAGQENKYEFPPPVDEKLFFGECIIVSTTTQSSLTCAIWKKVYEHLFGGFDDLEKLAVQDDAESDELENMPSKKKTKHGYLKDGFIIDSPRTKRTTISTKSLSLKMISGSHAFNDDIVECKDNCGDKTIADLVKRGDGYKRKIKDTDDLDEDDEDYEDDGDDNEDDDECDEDNDNEDDDGDDDEDEDDNGDDDEDEDDDHEVDDEDHDDHENDEEENENNEEDEENTIEVDNVATTSKAQPMNMFQQSMVGSKSKSQSQLKSQPQSQSQSQTKSKSSGAQSSTISIKKRSGGRANCEKKQTAMELVKCDNSRSSTKNAISTDDKRTKSTNLDSELEEEPYI